MSTNVMANFGVLDELVQVIYQGLDKFVVLSDVSNDRWNIHLGLTGPEGRWWAGSWRDVDVYAILGRTSSDTLLESLAGQLTDALVQGELYVDKGERYKLTFSPSSEKPKHVVLKEMSAAEAASYAADVFAVIALQAQSRQSRLNPSGVPFSGPSHVTPPAATSSSSSHTTGKRKAPEKTVNTEHKAEIPEKKSHASPDKIAPKPPPVARALKGASLANPNKKARKFQKIEFEDD